MPFGDRTGPRGLGPMTGRGMGYCRGYSYPGYLNPAGRGWGRGWGRGLGWGWRRHGYYPFGGDFYPDYPSQAPVSEENILKREKEVLGGQLEMLKEELKEVEKRLKELEKKGK